VAGAPISPDMFKSLLPQILPQLVGEIQRMLETSIPGVRVALKGDKVSIFIPWDAVVDSIRSKFLEKGVNPQIELYEDGMDIMIPVEALMFMSTSRTSPRLKKRGET